MQVSIRVHVVRPLFLRFPLVREIEIEIEIWNLNAPPRWSRRVIFDECRGRLKEIKRETVGITPISNSKIITPLASKDVLISVIGILPPSPPLPFVLLSLLLVSMVMELSRCGETRSSSRSFPIISRDYWDIFLLSIPFLLFTDVLRFQHCLICFCICSTLSKYSNIFKQLLRICYMRYTKHLKILVVLSSLSSDHS